MVLKKIELLRILYGSAFLGSGGGGMIKSGQTFINEINKRRKKVRLITHPLSEEDKRSLGCIVCDIGSITAFDDKQSNALDFAFKVLSKEFEGLGKIKALFPIETGPENTLAPFVLAAKHDISVVDGDGAGRAVPILSLSTFAVAKVNNRVPVAISNGVNDWMLISSKKIEEFDGILRSIAQIKTFSDSASLALWPDTIEELWKKSVQGVITRALHCGQLLEGIRNSNTSLIQKSLTILNQLKGYLIGMGTVIYKNGFEHGAFNITTTKIKNMDDSIITILSQNESLIAFSDRKSGPLAIAPDSICYLRSNFWPCTNAEIRPVKNEKQGRKERLYLIGVKADRKLQSQEIKKGFQKIIEELGYAGSMKIEPKAHPLGDLFIELKNKFPFS